MKKKDDLESINNTNDDLNFLNELSQEEKEKIIKEYEDDKKQNKDKIFNVKLLAFAATVFIIFKFILLHGIIPSESMQPTVDVNDFIVVNRLAYKSKEPNYGDIIIFKQDDNHIIKRVVGKPGDKIIIKDGAVYRNNNKLIEDEYIKENSYTFKGNQDEYNVPKDEFFVLGDNRENSLDSRFWNYPYVHKKDIVGELMFKYNFKIK